MTVRRPWLKTLAPLYGAVATWKRRQYAEGRWRSESLEGAVISVGSLSAGGAGKTPMVLLLAEMLGRRGYPVRILTRGYGRTSGAVERVDPEGDAARYGDEPLLLARRSGVPVYVGADRVEAGRMAAREEGELRGVSLLDDGFQHRRLRRDLDVVLLTKKDAEDGLLPAGDLREPLRTLREADVVVLREEEAEALGGLVAELTRDKGGVPVWRVRRTLVWGAEAPQRPLVFCGIARPEGFFAMLEAEGRRPAATLRFRDHHRYGERDVTRLVEEARRSGADGFCTTEKDAVKLTEATRRRMEEVGPVVAPELRVQLLEEKAAMEQMVARVRGLERRRSR